MMGLTASVDGLQLASFFCIFAALLYKSIIAASGFESFGLLEKAPKAALS
jgi:hypothetical protein